MRTSPVLLIPILVLALVAAACGEQTATAPASASASAGASVVAASAAASPESSAEASEDADDGSAALDCDALEGLMPASIGESTIATTCLSGEEIMQAGGSIPLDELEDAGVELEDAAVAIGSGSDGSSGVFMYSLPGADTEAFRDQMASGLEQVLSGSFSAVTIGGKDVLKGEGGTGGTGGTASYYLYVADDLLVWVLAPDDDAAAEVLADLP